MIRNRTALAAMAAGLLVLCSCSSESTPNEADSGPVPDAQADATEDAGAKLEAGTPCTESSQCVEWHLCLLKYPCQAPMRCEYYMPEPLNPIPHPVCGCDSQVHANYHAMVAEGTSLAEAKSCTPPDQYFPCGWRFCAPGMYCLHEDGAGSLVKDTCLDTPAACAPLSADELCDCLSAQHPNLNVQSCTTTPGGGVAGTTVTVQHPG